MSLDNFSTIHDKWFPYITNLLDILIVALFLYSVLLFLRRTRSFMVFLGLAITIILYFVAKDLNLKLTLLALQYFVSASVVVLAIVFQAEIRKYFELLGLIGTRQIKVGALVTKSPSISEIIQSSVKMAQGKVGALLVIQGSDILDQHMEGGIELDGVISEEVIMSIFDPNSDGHDGALIISNNRISKFGTHLPLSTNFKEIGKHGTRHSAALGLSEISDALCIVVSEEKGKISLCRNGTMKTLDELTDLEKELNSFIKTKFNQQYKSLPIYMVTHNFWLKLGATFLAIVMWLINNY